MKPSEVSERLRAVAAVVDSLESPSRWEAVTALRGILAALDDAHPRSKKPLQPKAPPKGEGWDPSASQPPPKLPGAMVSRRPDDATKGLFQNKDKRLQKLDRRLDREKEAMPEYASFQAFVDFLNEEDRDTYTAGERDKFCELNKVPQRTFDELMSAADKHLLKATGLKVNAPPAVLGKAAKELGVTVEDVRRFLNTFDGGSDLVDSKAIVDAMNEWMAA